MAEGTVLVIGSDPDFTQTLSEQLLQEMQLSCVVASSSEVAQPLSAGALLAVACEPVSEELSCPVIAITKTPFRLRELFDGIHAIRQQQLADDMTLVNGYVVQVRQKQLVHPQGTKPVSLTGKEVQLLQCLGEAQGKVVSREKLLKDVWGIDSALDTHTLETHIYRLRAKFRELGGDDNMIAALEGGYAIV